MIEAHWTDILELLHALPSSEEVAGILRNLGAPSHPQQIGIGQALLKDTFLYCKEIRARYIRHNTVGIVFFPHGGDFSGLGVY